MADRRNVIKGLEIQLDDLQKYAGANEMLTLTQEQAKEIVALLKEQEAEIAFLKAMQLQTVHNMSNEDIGNAVRNVLRL